VLSNDSIICWGVIDGAAGGVAVCAPANIEAVETVADARVRNTNRVPRRTMDDFIKVTPGLRNDGALQVGIAVIASKVLIESRIVNL
jgi:hypothetical protein